MTAVKIDFSHNTYHGFSISCMDGSYQPNRPVQTRMLDGVFAGGEKPQATLLGG